MTQRFWTWFLQTSTLLGVPVCFLLLIVGAQKFIFTATCEVAGWRCEHSLNNSGAGLDYIAGLVDGATGEDTEPPMLNAHRRR